MNQAIKKALSDFESIQSISDLETLFRNRSALIYRRFGFDNHVQVYLAWGILLIALGREEEGEKLLKKFYLENKCNPSDPVLLKAVKLARTASSNAL